MTDTHLRSTHNTKDDIQDNTDIDYDFVIIGSGFGGSVSALRLSEKGYKVLVMEKGKWLKQQDFPKTNWHLKRWLWLPFLRFFGLFKMTFFRHVGVLSGVGVGGGSLVYANTLPVPSKRFFTAKSWSHLADWEQELTPHYKTALRMLGATENPVLQPGDKALQQLACDMGKEKDFHKTQVAVFFGEQGKTVKDPYFGGEGPDRAGCTFCGGCMLGCRYNAKNTLDKNYLYFAQKKGAKIQAESEVTDVRPIAGAVYEIEWQSSTRFQKSKHLIRAKHVVFAGGVMGTVKLLLKLKEGSLSKLSDKLGTGVRTNSEALIAVTTPDTHQDLSKGVAIGAILNTDENSHLEAVRYSAGAGFWRLSMYPLVHGRYAIERIGRLLWNVIRHPIDNFKIMTVKDWAKQTQILLFMQTVDSTLKFTRGKFGMSSSTDQGTPPTAFIPEARDIGDKYAEKLNGKPTTLITETLFGIPTTAHILGGATMGENASEGVIDKDNKLFGYDNMWVCDGSMISANIGVNPSLTITALTERAMSKIPEKAK